MARHKTIVHGQMRSSLAWVRCAIATLAALALASISHRAVAQEAREIEHQGVKRSAIVVNAASAKDGPKPTWIVLHGRRDPAAANRSSPVLDALAAREKFVAIYPAAIAGRWRYPGQSANPVMVGAVPADDVGFLQRLIDQLIAETIADRRRIYVSGASLGALMTYSLMCAIPERLAAAAPMIASMTEGQMAACKPARGLPIAMLAGTEDTIVPYDGWLYDGYRLSSVPETIDFWRRLHGCTGQRRTDMPSRSETERTRTALVEWTGCKLEGAVRLYRVQGGGHTLPTLSAQSVEDEKAWGRRSADFETSHELWSFFKQWSLP